MVSKSVSGLTVGRRYLFVAVTSNGYPSITGATTETLLTIQSDRSGWYGATEILYLTPTSTTITLASITGNNGAPGFALFEFG